MNMLAMVIFVFLRVDKTLASFRSEQVPLGAFP
jgi:hypothetical protein